jgi:hypothetical protein
MPTVRTVTVKPSGGDYTSLANAEAGEQADLVTLDRQLDIECYAMLDSSRVTFDGWTTDATRFIRVLIPATERHDGKWNTSAYRITGAFTFNSAVTINEDYIRLEGIQTQNTDAATNSTSIIVTATAGASDVRIGESIIRNGNSTSLYWTQGTGRVQNTLLYGCFAGVGLNSGGNFHTDTLTVDNSTCVANATYGFFRNSDNLVLRNCYAGGNGTAAYNGTMTRTTCAHSSATAYAGSTANVAYDGTNFADVTAGNEDLHLVSGSALIDAGTDLSATFSGDIDGDTRSGTWDIGADEFVAVGSSVAPDDLAHAHTLGSPSLTQVHAVSPDDVAHAHTLGSPSLTQIHAVSPDDLAHAHALDSPAIAQLHRVSPDDLAHAHVLGSPLIGGGVRYVHREVFAEPRYFETIAEARYFETIAPAP